MVVEHTTLDEGESHEIGYRQASDPGAVGAGIAWIDTTGGTGAWVLKIRNAADTGWETVGSGGATADYTKWDPDAPPASPSSDDDEFDNETFNTTLWTEFDNGSDLTISEEEYGLLFTPTSGSTDVMGCWQANPGTFFSIMTRVNPLASLYSGSFKQGLVIYEDAASNPTTCKLITFVIDYATTGVALQIEYWNNYSSHNSNILVQRLDHPVMTGGYLRIRMSYFIISTYMNFDYSTDGISWAEIHSIDVSSYFTPDEVGLCIKSSSNSFKGIFQFFRALTTTTPGFTTPDLMEGDRVDGFSS